MFTVYAKRSQRAWKDKGILLSIEYPACEKSIQNKQSFLRVIRMALGFDTEELRVLSWRASTKDIGAVVGPPGWQDNCWECLSCHHGG